MKKTLLIWAVATLFGGRIEAQSGYTFTKDTAAYIELGAGALTADSGWQYSFSYAFPNSPFFEDLFGQSTNGEYFINSQGSVQFTGYLTNDEIYTSAVGEDLVGFANSQLGRASYEIDMVNGNHVLKVQYKNVGFANDQTYQNAVNFQIWLYAGLNMVEYRYGPSMLTGAITTINAGIYDETAGSSIELFGDPANPTASTGSYYNGGLTGVPQEKTLYRFIPNATSVGLVTAGQKDVIANYMPMQSKIDISALDKSAPIVGYELYNMGGQTIIKQMNLNTIKTSVTTSTLPGGIYLLKVISAKATITKKLLIN